MSKLHRKVTDVPASLKGIDVKAVLRKRGVYLKQKANREMKEAALPIARKMLAIKKKSPEPEVQHYVHFTNDEAIAYAHKQIHIIEVIEKRFDLKVQQFITKVVNGFLSHLEAEIATTKSIKNLNKDYFSDNEDDYLAQAQIDFTPLLVDQAVLAGQEALKLIGSSDIYTPYKYRDVIADNVKKFTQSMLDTDRETLINIISNGITEGQSIPEIRGAIETDFDNITKSQALRISRTEVARASTQASKDAWEQSGLVEGSQWVVIEGGDECDDYDGQIESLDGNFYSDTSEFADGDPPLHPNCKCQLVPILLDESKVYIPNPNKALLARISELESMSDKRTKAFKKLKAEHREQRADDAAYIKSLEKYLKVDDEQAG